MRTSWRNSSDPARFRLRPTRRELFLALPLARAYAANGVIETVLAPATPENRRNSEGDIVVLRDGTLLAAWSDFHGGAEDHSTARISAARSGDGGRSWGPRYTLQENIGRQNVMSVSFLRGDRGEILFFFLVKNSESDLYPVVRRSRDDGRTWSDPVRVVKDPGYYIVNNARIVRLRSGRVLCPSSFVADIGKRGAPLRTVMYFSDDGGRSWVRGKGEVACPLRGAMEPGLLEMRDGRLLQIIRTQTGRIWRAWSRDGGDTWSEASPWTVAAPEAPSTLARIPETGELLIVYNPAVRPGAGHSGRRTPLVAAVSRDEGKTWSKPVAVETDPRATYAYTSITFHDGRVLLTYYSESRGLLSLKFKSIPVRDVLRERTGA